jgi:hypothetical protein
MKGRKKRWSEKAWLLMTTTQVSGQRGDALFQTGFWRDKVAVESSLEEGIAPLSEFYSAAGLISLRSINLRILRPRISSTRS